MSYAIARVKYRSASCCIAGTVVTEAPMPSNYSCRHASARHSVHSARALPGLTRARGGDGGRLTTVGWHPVSTTSFRQWRWRRQLDLRRCV